MEELIQFHAEPFPSSSIYAQYRVMKLAKPHVTVLLDGQGADELLAGYHYFFGYYFKDLLRSVKPLKAGGEMFHYLKQHRSTLGLKSLAFFLLPGSMRNRLQRKNSDYLHPEFLQKQRGLLSDELYGAPTLYDALLNHIEYKLEHLLKWEDRNSMHFSLEGRVPFLDYRLVEKTLALNGRDLIHRGTTKHIFREAMRGVLPESIRTRQDKVGFATPQDEWFREIRFQKWYSGMIKSPIFIERKIINNDTIIKFNELDKNGIANKSKEVWKLINLELWFRKFIESK